MSATTKDSSSEFWMDGHPGSPTPAMAWTADQKAARNTKKKAARTARRRNRRSS